MQSKTAETLFPAKSERNIDLEVRTSQLETIYAQNVNAFIGQLLSAIVCVILVWQVVPTLLILIWLGVMLLTQTLRYVHSLRLKALSRPLDDAQVIYWLRWHILFTFFTAATWSIGALILWPDSISHQVIYFVVVLHTIAASLVGHSSHKLSYSIYALTASVPIALRFFAAGTRDHIAFGIAILIGVAMLLRIAQRNNKASVQALWLGVNYREQAAVLAEEKSRVESLNQQLMQQAQALRQSEARFRALSEAAFEGIAIHDQGRILDANHSALAMFGLDTSDLEGLTIQRIVPPESFAVAARHIAEDYDKPYEITGLRKDGTTFPIEIQAKSIANDGGRVRVVGVRDLTVRKELERQALELKLEHARVELLTKFFDNASHEFRTPLSIISVATHLVSRVGNAEKRQQKLDEIDQQVARINELVDGLQFMLKLDVGMDMNRGKVDIHSRIEYVVNSRADKIKSKHQQLNLQLSGAAMPISGDAELLDAAFAAILDNALRYTPDGGTISIKTWTDADAVTVKFQDNGIGMPADVLDRIFERFYRADAAHSTSGFGIGLSIARSIIELHNGTISVESHEDSGSTFTIGLPLLDKHTSPQTQSLEEPVS
ncbi:MAG: PAS domain S-box protein [Anaerolineae bacterium]|nr:PAS domain S-box protein [Anaerolineae bacterium]